MNGSLSLLLGCALILVSGCATLQPPEPLPQVDYSTLEQRTPPQEPGSIYRAGHSLPLFEDLRARRVGDVLTVILTEETRASKSATTTIAKENTTDIDNPTLFGLPVTLERATKGKLGSLEQNIAASREFSGSGKSDQSNRLDGSIQVVVVEELPNRYLRIAGEKVLSINQGDERVRITGIVRPEDIRVDNTVLSTRVANARITYRGTGVLADSNDMGWLGKLFNSKWFPF